ncbi:protein of unknown function [Saccharicrinis carchari]|uniref:DUF4249 family protein n=1 Tax=Saccharicrinis carchari TaxID=1168039 RepID=A0A521BYJ9_SACCC|nr:DUF4249 family protein [Saccharicrinis carchari]SMO52253.1 protein of unknown function [Saccharicrinis carchari]
MKRIIYLSILLAILLPACVENRELSFNGLHTEPGYFIECYLIPGDIYRLSATKLQPLYEDYILDYSLELKVKIDTLLLEHGLYKQEHTQYLYNYTHPYHFMPAQNALIELMLITLENDTVLASTTVPAKVNILNPRKDNNEISFDFTLSPQSIHNYYMLNISLQQADTVYRKNRFLDYGHLNTKDTVTFSYDISHYGDSEKISVVLRRITKANYDYQISLQNAKDANRDNLVLPSPLAGNLKNATGIFTCFTCDSVVWRN